MNAEDFLKRSRHAVLILKNLVNSHEVANYCFDVSLSISIAQQESDEHPRLWSSTYAASSITIWIMQFDWSRRNEECSISTSIC
jgi:hypothetical protein